MNKRITAILTLTIVLLFSLTACGALKDVSDMGNKFMSALSTQDNATSYAMLSPDIQAEVGYEAGWADWTSIRDFEKWKFNSTSVENDTATLEGTAQLDGEEYQVTLQFTNFNNEWKLTTIIFE